MHKMYDELAQWWHLLSSPDDYEEEVAFFMPLIEDILDRPHITMLELGSGGGNNALYMKSAFESVTLVDLSPRMLDMSCQINPDCEHLQGDMRTVRLDRTFDVVFVHDAIDYMLTHDDMRQAIQTAFVHCKSGGAALFVPDTVRETFEESTEHGGTDSDEDAGRGVRYLEWSYDPDPTDTTYITQYIIAVRDGDQPVQVTHDQHIVGLFALDDWMTLFTDAGFKPSFVVDSYNRFIFVARKPE